MLDARCYYTIRQIDDTFQHGIQHPTKTVDTLRELMFEMCRFVAIHFQYLHMTAHTWQFKKERNF